MVEKEQVESYELPEDVKAAADKAKADGLTPYWVSLNGKNFLYRAIKRGEWKALSRDQNKELLPAQDDPLAIAEIKDKYVEIIVKTCIIWSDVPVDDNLGAGFVDTLSDVILIDSGFGNPDGPPMQV